VHRLIQLANRKRKKNKNWIDDQLKSAIADFNEGIPIRAIARKNGILTSTLKGHIYGTTLYRRRGKKGVLIDVEEAAIIDYLIKMQNL